MVKNTLNLKNSSGITLIVLIITIIVLIIIAGISIYSLVNNKNLIDNSLDIKKEVANKDVEEEISEQWLLAQNNYKNGFVSNTDLANELQRRLKKYDSSATVAYNNQSKVFSIFYNNGNYTIDLNGKVTKQEANNS